MDIEIREAVSADIPAIKTIMPRLAEFELPPKRAPELFYTTDMKLLDAWAAGDADHVFVHVAIMASRVVGATIVSMGEEFFDYSPSAHLEVAVIAKEADGMGIGRKLIAEAEREAQKRGASSMSLHVVRNNYRARQVYEKIGYEEELVRCIKHFS